jgi:hypothetical protein
MFQIYLSSMQSDYPMTPVHTYSKGRGGQSLGARGFGSKQHSALRYVENSLLNLYLDTIGF